MLAKFLYLLIVIIFLSASSVLAEGKKLNNIQEGPLISFPKLFADPYEIQMGFSKSLSSDRFIGRIGQEMRLFSFGPANRKIQFSLGGHTWSLLTRRGSKFPLLAVDYLITGIFDFRFGEYSARFKVSHISAHLGDFYATQNIDKAARIYSLEFFSGLLARNFEWGNLYGGGHWIYNSKPELKSIKLQTGSTIYLEKLFKTSHLPFLSFDLQYGGNVSNEFNRNVQVGYFLFRKDSRTYRLAVNHYSGYSIFGQNYDVREQFYSAGLFINY